MWIGGGIKIQDFWGCHICMVSYLFFHRCRFCKTLYLVQFVFCSLQYVSDSFLQLDSIASCVHIGSQVFGFWYRSVTILPARILQDVSRNGRDCSGLQSQPGLSTLDGVVCDIVNLILGCSLFRSVRNMCKDFYCKYLDSCSFNRMNEVEY